MGNVIVMNQTNMAINFGLLVLTPYWMVNDVKPWHKGTFENVGCVWYSVEVLPWYGPPSEISLGQNSWEDFVSRFDDIKTNITKTGTANLQYFKLIGHNLTEMEVDERLHKMAFWGDGYYACGKTYCVKGGPTKYATKSERIIDITDNFDPVTVTECNSTQVLFNDIQSNEVYYN